MHIPPLIAPPVHHVFHHKDKENMPDEEQTKSGRPSKYDPAFAKQAEALCKLGATNADLADFFEVTIRTIERWSSSKDDFCRALKMGKAEADERVERSLYHRAVGYTFDSEIVKITNDGSVYRTPTREHVPPDTTAAIFWLKNRDPSNWRDKREHEVKGQMALTPTINYNGNSE